MMAVLNQAELREAVLEWCEKRDLPVHADHKVTFAATLVKGNALTANPKAPEFEFEAIVEEISLMGSPYR